MDKQNEYDPLFSELKNEIHYEHSKKSQALHHIKTMIPRKQTIAKKKSVTPWLVSISTIVVAASLVFLFINDWSTDLKNTSNEPNQPSETSNPVPSENYPENHTVFDVENFGIEHLQLKNDVIFYLSTTYKMGNNDILDVFDTAKVDENGIAIINFNESFVYAVNNSMGTAGAGELMRTLNSYVFSYNDVQTAYYLLDGNASAWNEWLQFVDEPINREIFRQFEKYKITKEFVEKNAKIGLSYGEVTEVFGIEAYSGVMDNTMTFVYDSTLYKPFGYNKGDDAVAFDEIKNEKLDYQLYINFWEGKAVYYQYYFKGDDGEVWGYTISEQGDNLTRNSGN